MDSNSQIVNLAPMLLEPLFMEKIWGTPDLRPWYDHVTDVSADHNPIGEVWLTGDECRVQTGVLTGKTLGEVFAEHSLAMWGSSAPESMHGVSPLLMKVLFAKEKLSVQVHPDDRMAQKYGDPRGKTECWYVLAAEPDAEIAVGLRRGVTLEKVEAGVADGTLEDGLEVLPVTAGEMVFLDAGTVHALWPGSVLLETQQNCDITYRLFDYGRPRELHVAKALEAIRLETSAGQVAPIELPDRTVLVDSKYFCLEKMVVEGTRTGSSMRGTEVSGLAYLFAAEGSGRIRACENDGFEAVDLPKCGIVAIPSSSPDWQVEDLGGLKLIRITPRWPKATS